MNPDLVEIPTKIIEPTAEPAIQAQLIGQPQLRQLTFTSADSVPATGLLLENQPFTVNFTLDLTKTTIANDASLSYKVVVYVKPLNGGSRQILGKIHDTLVAATDKIPVEITSQGLNTGFYRLEATVVLTQPPDGSNLTALREGHLFQVHQQEKSILADQYSSSHLADYQRKVNLGKNSV